MIIAGIMTGTSLDGIDVVINKFSGDDVSGFNKELLAYNTFKFKESTQKAINKILHEHFFAFEISQMHFILAKIFNKAIIELCEESNFDYERIEAIGVHGQTIWHQPLQKRFAGESISSTMQLFSGTALSAISGKKVVYDFRSGDVALGGQGAPLVPIYDYYFLKNSDENLIALNIGGIANLTFLPKKCTKDDVLAFDTGPGNILIDIAASHLFNQEYDFDGNLASKGNIINDLMEKLQNVEFIHMKPPKSTGRELFNPIFLNNILFNEYDKFDVMRTLTEFTALSISENIIRFADKTSKIIVSGGGASNKFLMESLRTYLNRSVFINPEDIGINIDVKEAECFAFLAYLNLKKIPGNLPKVSGASREIILGAVAG